MPRIDPVTAPFDDVAGPLIASMMPGGADPIGLFRTFVRNPTMSAAMHPWGSYELGRTLSISMREREIVIVRTCAHCRCEYEWGVHLAFFATKVDLDRPQLVSLTNGTADDPCWTDPGERVLIRAVDELHERSDVDDATWAELAAHRSEGQLLDVLLLAGWYHAISYAATAARVDLEPWAPRFADFADPADPADHADRAGSG